MAEKELSTRNTKAEILNAYNEMLQKLEDKKEENPKQLIQEKQKTETVKSASDNNSEKIVKEISGLKLSLGNSLDKIEESLLNEFKKLRDIQDAIKIEKQNLEETYQLSSQTDSLAAMLLAQKEEKNKFEDDIQEQRQAFNQEMVAAKAKLESEIAETKASWEKEKKEYEERIKEDKAQTAKDRKREEEEYTYKLNLERKKDKDLYEEKKLKLEKELAERNQTFEKEIAERELAVSNFENEFAQLKEKAEKFPSELEEAIKKAKAETEVTLKTQYKFEKDLREKEYEGQLNLKEQSIQTLGSKIKDLEELISQLTKKAEGADKSVKDIAIKAIESSSKIQVVGSSRDEEKQSDK